MTFENRNKTDLLSMSYNYWEEIKNKLWTTYAIDIANEVKF